MAVESGFLDIGFLVSDGDFRNSTITGTTLPGPSGSGQFLAVKLSTVNNYAISLATSSTNPILGILQNKPSTGIAADVKIAGVSKAVAGTTSFTFGSKLMLSATSTGTVTIATTTATYFVGQALEQPTAVGAVFSMLIYGGAVGFTI